MSGRAVAQEKYEGLPLAHSLSSTRASSLIKNTVRSTVPTSIMASWEAEDAQAKEKEAICLLGPMPQGISKEQDREKPCVVSSKSAPGSSQLQGTHIGLGPGHGGGFRGPGSSFNTSTSPLAS